MLASAVAQQAAKHVLTGDELKKAIPAEYFFRGQKAPVNRFATPLAFNWRTER